MAFEIPNVSSDLVWAITRSQNAFLVKRNTSGGSQFSRDTLNLANKHSRKYAGYANDKAIGVQPSEQSGVVFLSKTPSNLRKPAQNSRTITWGPNASNRKIYKGIANNAAKNRYRADLRGVAIARASAIRKSQRPKKNAPEPKLRGARKSKKTPQNKSL